MTDARERNCDVLGLVAIDRTDEAQRNVQLVVALPARAGNPAHRRDQGGAHHGGRPRRDEQTMTSHSALSGFA